MDKVRLYEGHSYEFYRALYEVWSCRTTSDPTRVRELDRMLDLMRMQFDPLALFFREIEVAGT